MDFCGFFLPIISRNGGDDDDLSTISKPIPYDTSEECISPFIKYNENGYTWPDLFTEVDECLEACVLIYPLAELRRLARANLVENAEKILSLPLTRT